MLTMIHLCRARRPAERWLAAAFAGVFWAGLADAAVADVNVAATITPVHSLVAMVTEGVSSPALIVRPGASPHGYAMKPSEARALDQADVVFWVGEALEPWMAKAIDTLAADALVVELGAAEEVDRLGVREGGVWDDHRHDHHGDDHDVEHDHEHQEHAHDEVDHHDVRYDPHLWLDPDNAIAWLGVIADALATADPAEAERYRSNANHAVAALQDMTSSIETALAPVKEKPFIVFHDAYQYFERRFDLHAVGSISLSDADRPGAARLSALRERLRSSGAVCAFAEPQFEPKLLDTVIEGSSARKGELDPIGADLEPGNELYPALIKRMAQSLVDCLS